MYLLDTNVVSELRKGTAGRAHPGVVDWVSSVSVASLFLSAITMYELELGALRLARRDPDQGAVLRAWLDNDVARSFAERVIPVDERVARETAALNVPDPAPIRDALIGATALVHSMAVVTRNTTDFARFDGLEVINPWT